MTISSLIIVYAKIFSFLRSETVVHGSQFGSSALNSIHAMLGQCGRSLTRIAFALMLMSACTVSQALAHSVSVGYVVNGPGSITVYFGSYHAGLIATEGDITLTGPTNLTSPATILTSTKPAGLIDGTTNFYADTCPGGTCGGPIQFWQGATFTGLTGGGYQIALINAVSADWTPWDDSIGSGATFNISVPPATSEAPAIIARFLNRRTNLLLQSQPNSDRQIERLGQFNQANGNGSNPSPYRLGGPQQRFDHEAEQTTSHIAANGSSSPLAGFGADGMPLPSHICRSNVGSSSRSLPDVAFTGQEAKSMELSASLRDVRNQAKKAKKQELTRLLGVNNYSKLGVNQIIDQDEGQLPWDIWAEAKYTDFEDDSDGNNANGYFGVFRLGADYIVNPWLLIGALVQYDVMEDKSQTRATLVEGNGWMIGPYATVKLSDNVFFQTGAGWGKSKNDISPTLTYTDSFDTERWLARGKLKGIWHFGDLKFSPDLSVAYIEEHQKSYTDTLDVLIPSQTVSLGQAELGPEFSYTIQREDGRLFIPRIGIKGVWNFAHDNGALVSGMEVGASDLRGKAEAGFSVSDTNGISLDLSGSYDGLGDDDYSAMSGRAILTIPFN